MIHSILTRTISVPKNLSDTIIWTLSKPVSHTNYCMPASAVSVYCHRFNIKAQEDIDTLFEKFESAYKKRIGNYLFNSSILNELNLKEKITFEEQILEISSPIDPILKWVSKRKQPIIPPIPLYRTIQNTAFILVLTRPNEAARHAITITCDGLWKPGGTFSFQDSIYADNRLRRYERVFPDLPSFSGGLSQFLSTNGYHEGKIQAICLEPN